jgi:hypothetical protein
MKTWAEFHDTEKPKDGDKFVDDRGDIWNWCDDEDGFVLASNGHVMDNCNNFWDRFICTLTRYVEPEKLWPAICRGEKLYWISDLLFGSEEEAKKCCQHFIKWPAIPNADGSYKI